MEPANINQEQGKELLDAQTHIWNHIFSYHNTMALKCALQLGILECIHKHGKPMTISELANELKINPKKAPSLYRLMRFLCHSNFFFNQKSPNNQEAFSLTLNSQLLLKDHPLSHAPFALAFLDPITIEQAYQLEAWFRNEDQTPFYTAHGELIWEYASHSPEFNVCVNKAMASDTLLVADLLVKSEVFKGLLNGVESLVDVAGGDGTIAKAISKAFPSLKCSVLDLPHVVEGNIGHNNLSFVGGDMFQAIPPAHNVFLKWILHDWDDDHCLRILKLCKEAIQAKIKGGKVIIIDMVVATQDDKISKDYATAQLMLDMSCMNYYGGGKERTEQEWKDLFTLAGFNEYTIFPVLGPRSIIVAYPS